MEQKDNNNLNNSAKNKEKAKEPSPQLLKQCKSIGTNLSLSAFSLLQSPRKTILRTHQTVPAVSSLDLQALYIYVVHWSRKMGSSSNQCDTAMVTPAVWCFLLIWCKSDVYYRLTGQIQVTRASNQCIRSILRLPHLLSTCLWPRLHSSWASSTLGDFLATSWSIPARRMCNCSLLITFRKVLIALRSLFSVLLRTQLKLHVSRKVKMVIIRRRKHWIQYSTIQKSSPCNTDSIKYGNIIILC